MKRVIIDTDPGIDDAAALLLALAAPELAVDAVTTVYGNGTIEQSTRNALIILETAGRGDIPVYQGAAKPLLGGPHFAHHVHGNDAFGDMGWPAPIGKPQPTHAVRELVDRVMARPGEITLIALGQLRRIRQAQTPTTTLLTRITPCLIRSYVDRDLMPPGTGVHYNDVSAMAYAIDPRLFEVQEYSVRIATHDPLTRGQTVADVANRWRQPPNAKVPMGVDAARLTDIFTTRVIGYS